MTNNQIMKKYLRTNVIEQLFIQGFTGKYPHFRREKENCIELISFQTNNYGSSFTVEVSAVFPDRENKNFVFWDGLTVDDLTVWNTDKRYRLKGMYNGWFYYRDLYRKYIFGFGKDYIDVNENYSSTVAPKGYKLVQRFDEHTAGQICDEINKQLVKAFRWLARFEKRSINFKSFK